MSVRELPVNIYMNTPTYTVRADDTLEHAHALMLERSVSCLAVIENQGRLAGVISRSDLLHAGTAKERDRWSRALVLPTKSVRDVMSPGAISVDIGASVRDAARLMVEHHVHRVFVTARGDVTGVLSTLDIMRAVADADGNARPLSQFMSTPVATIESHLSISEATRALERSGLHGLVVTERDLPIGVFADIDALEARDWPPEHPVDQVMNARILCLSPDMPLRRAAEQAAATRVRRVLCTHGQKLAGILTGIDFARALIDPS
jgi:CBS domain-containing protein